MVDRPIGSAVIGHEQRYGVGLNSMRHVLPCRQVLCGGVAVLVIALVGCGVPASTAPTSAPPTSSPSVGTQTPAPTRSIGASIDFTLSGTYAIRLTTATVSRGTAVEGSGAICQKAGAPIDATFNANDRGAPVSVLLKVNGAPGPQQAFVVVVPPASVWTPPPNPYAVGVGSWSTFRGSATIASDGMSGSLSADLSYAGGPVAEHVAGNWTCR
jgi:hypothetical protein